MLILGLDASSVAIGFAILNEKEELILTKAIKLNSSLSYEKRALLFEKELKEIREKYKISKVFLEEPMIATFGGSGSSFTTAILNSISGMYRYVVFKVFHKEAKLLNVRSVRSKLGIKFDKTLKGKQKKQQIIDFVKSIYDESFQYDKTKFGNAIPLTDDRADAIVIALGGMRYFNE
jgi:Holliday junction resolvasome RuvABC endonuclease subunit